MTKKLKIVKFGISLVITIILTLGFSISLQSLFAAWTAPNANPPENNITDLTISGGLGVNGNMAIAGTSTLAVDGGNVGIGTTSPRFDLEVSGSESQNIVVSSLGSDKYSRISVFNENSLNMLSLVSYGNTATGYWNSSFHYTSVPVGDSIAMLGSSGTPNLVIGNPGGSIYFGVGGGINYGEAPMLMKLDSITQNVGIGATSPSSQLHLYKNDNVNNAEIALQSGNGTILQNKWSIYNNGIDASGKDGSLRFWNDSITGEKNALTVLNNGNVGIGTTNPQQELHVKGINAGIRFESSEVGTSNFEINNGGWGGTFGLAVQDRTAVGDPVRLYIKTDGKVGIGTTNPNARLDIRSDATVTPFEINGGGNSKEVEIFRFYKANGTEVMRLNGDGDVGIGTNNPSTKLDVNGTTKTTQVNSGNYCDASGGNCKAITAIGSHFITNRHGSTGDCNGWCSGLGLTCVSGRNTGDWGSSTVSCGVWAPVCECK